VYGHDQITSFGVKNDTEQLEKLFDLHTKMVKKRGELSRSYD